jgi:hypothetical protein
MRFITEFELLTPFEIKNYKSLREKGTAEWLGLDIARAFGWQQKGETTLRGPVSERHSLEIEAFPMDKWMEFRKRLLAALPDYDTTSRIRIENALHDLESFNITNRPG